MFSLIFNKTLSSLVLFSFFIEISRQSVDTPGIERNVWRMIPDAPHRVVEENSTLTLTWTYDFGDEMDHQIVSWKWELPDFLTKYPQVIFSYF